MYHSYSLTRIIRCCQLDDGLDGNTSLVAPRALRTPKTPGIGLSEQSHKIRTEKRETFT